MQGISAWLEEATQPGHTFYHPVQACLFGGISWLGASLFSIPKTNAVAVSVTAYAISQFTTPLISEWLEPYMEISLIPLCGQVGNLSLAFCSANILCYLAGKSISINAAMILVAFLLATIALLRFGFNHLNQHMIL